MEINEVVEALEDDLHEARHHCFQLPVNDHPYVDFGWNAGFMFGVHFAHQYPALSGRMDRAVFFESDPKFVGPNRAADIVAQAMRNSVFPKKVIDEDGQLDKWKELKENREAIEIVDDPEWKLPGLAREGWQSELL